MNFLFSIEGIENIDEMRIIRISIAHHEKTRHLGEFAIRKDERLQLLEYVTDEKGDFYGTTLYEEG